MSQMLKRKEERKVVQGEIKMSRSDPIIRDICKIFITLVSSKPRVLLLFFVSFFSSESLHLSESCYNVQS